MNSDDRFFNVRHYGAVGDGVTDDREALQELIVEASEKGGVLFFPPGEYQLSITYDEFLKQLIGLRMFENVSLIGLNRSLCKIKLADGQPQYNHLITHYFRNPIRDINISGLTFDQNKLDNPITPEQLYVTPQRTIGFWVGDNISVTDCRFTNFATHNNVMFSPEMYNLNVSNNLFDNINGTTDKWHDYSAIYLRTVKRAWRPHGSGMWIQNNIFRSDGNFGATTAIETHGSNAFVSGNFIEGLQIGMIITGERANRTEMVSVTNNQVHRCHNGIQLWSRKPGVNGVQITGNQITIDLDLFQWRHNFGTGLMVPDHNNAPIKNFIFSGNIIRYLPYTISPYLPLSNCFTALNSQAEKDENWHLKDNMYIGCPGENVRIDPEVKELVND